MHATLTRPPTAPPDRPCAPVPQWSRPRIAATWAAAALPMALLAWVVAPTLAAGGGSDRLSRILIVCLTAGLLWQFALVVAIVWHEQRTLRWHRVRDALWLRAPRSPRDGRVGGRAWLVVVPLVLGLAVVQLLPSPPAVAGHDLGEFLASDAGRAMFHGSWGWFAFTLVMFLLNTVFGEELLFRGLLLPRMHGAFGDRDWVANGVLFTAYHLHAPWAMPGALADMFLLSRPTKRTGSALVGIAVHSAQSVVLAALVLTLVL